MNKLISTLAITTSVLSFSATSAYLQEVDHTTIDGRQYDSIAGAFQESRATVAKLEGMTPRQLEIALDDHQWNNRVSSSFQVVDVKGHVKEVWDKRGEMLYQPVTTVVYTYRYNDSERR
ncbi:hypothetical protein DZ860_01645 [Vibrio sinensis]|uniref:DUF3316 domain-containing protein n=1 Tax=Vibrio sinensis TaxID=2302434 RepID=A0A3A6QR56_9VIBR|nr:hypothetical protein [Vibrio sinensis]RJX75410.1 hypothetical protein DZ860_01645 [Vibrio sinensis]